VWIFSFLISIFSIFFHFPFFNEKFKTMNLIDEKKDEFLHRKIKKIKTTPRL
jgi:hypothetical protein